MLGSGEIIDRWERKGRRLKPRITGQALSDQSLKKKCGRIVNEEIIVSLTVYLELTVYTLNTHFQTLSP